MKPPYNVLVIDDEEAASRALRAAFEGCLELHFSVRVAGTLQEAEEAMRNVTYDVITIDLSFSQEGMEGGLELMSRRMVFAASPHSVKLVVTGYPSVERCVRAMRLGAWDFIGKDVREGVSSYPMRAVRSAVERLIQLHAERELETHILEQWLPENEALLLASFPDEYVAVAGDRVVAHAKSIVLLGMQLNSGNWSGTNTPFVLRVEGRTSK